MSFEPYLSVVAAARNDDHGGNPLYRTQLFIEGLVEQVDRYELPTELVLVEWNPPADRPRLADTLDWPQGTGFCDVRIIEVPHELHSTLAYSDRLPLFQMIAKNVGIRRARGAFVLATNIDILFSDALMRYLAERRPEPGNVYTTDRHDVPAEIDPNWPIERRLAFCRANAIRVHRREGTLDLRSGDFYRIYPEVSPRAWIRNSRLGPWLYSSRVARVTGLGRLALALPVPHTSLPDRISASRPAAALAFLRATQLRRAFLRVRWFLFRVYAFVYWFVAAFNSPRQLTHRLARLARPSAVPRETHVAGSTTDAARPGRRPLAAVAKLLRPPARFLTALLALARRRWAETESRALDELARVRLHTNASGDFTLMAREDWAKTRGYAELEMYSMHIDGLQLYIAHYSGIAERFLPFPIYHIEHGGGFRPEAKGSDALAATLERRTIPQITNERLMGYIRTMYVEKAPVQPNGEDWGFASADLDETKPQHRDPRIGATGARRRG